MTNTSDKIRKALELKKEEKFEEALDILNDLSKSSPSSNNIKTALIEVLFDYGAYLNDEMVLGYEKAVECYKKIIGLDANNYRAWYNLGIAYFNLEKSEKALQAYEKALIIRPDYEYVYYNIGLLYEIHKGDLEKALEFYQKALKINPNLTYALQASKDVRQKLDYMNMSKKDQEAPVICLKCGNMNRYGAKYCDKCGEPI